MGRDDQQSQESSDEPIDGFFLVCIGSRITGDGEGMMVGAPSEVSAAASSLV
jgi:hypothetical protein